MTMPKLRTDNGPQFIARRFEETCQALGAVHGRTPVKIPNLNAHIEAFHAILERECYGRHEFEFPGLGLFPFFLRPGFPEILPP